MAQRFTGLEADGAAHRREHHHEGEAHGADQGGGDVGDREHEGDVEPDGVAGEPADRRAMA
jgi:hypothetical protein